MLWASVGRRYKEDSDLPHGAEHGEKDHVRKAIVITLLEVPPAESGVAPFFRSVWCPMRYTCRFY
jgi:hypothetical protein